MTAAPTDVSRRSLRAGPPTAVGFATGMSAARRPTGIILGTLVAIAAFASITGTGRLLQLVLPAEVSQVIAPVGSNIIFLSAWLLLWLWLRVKEQRSFATIGFFHRSRSPLLLARGAVVALGAMVVIVGVGLITGNLAVIAQGDGSLVDWSSLGLVAISLLAFGVQGGAEEIVSRGYLFQVWFRRVGLIGAVVAQSLFFTVAHAFNDGFDVLPVVTLLLVSILLVFWALAEGSLWGPLAFHAVWNWSMGSFLGISVSGTPSPGSLLTVGETTGANTLISGGAFGVEGSVTTPAVLALLAAAAVLAYRRSRARAGTAADRMPRTAAAAGRDA